MLLEWAIDCIQVLLLARKAIQVLVLLLNLDLKIEIIRDNLRIYIITEYIEPVNSRYIVLSLAMTQIDMCKKDMER